MNYTAWSEELAFYKNNPNWDNFVTQEFNKCHGRFYFKNIIDEKIVLFEWRHQILYTHNKLLYMIKTLPSDTNSIYCNVLEAHIRREKIRKEMKKQNEERFLMENENKQGIYMREEINKQNLERNNMEDEDNAMYNMHWYFYFAIKNKTPLSEETWKKFYYFILYNIKDISIINSSNPTMLYNFNYEPDPGYLDQFRERYRKFRERYGKMTSYQQYQYTVCGINQNTPQYASIKYDDKLKYYIMAQRKNLHLPIDIINHFKKNVTYHCINIIEQYLLHRPIKIPLKNAIIISNSFYKISIDITNHIEKNLTHDCIKIIEQYLGFNISFDSEDDQNKKTLQEFQINLSLTILNNTLYIDVD